MSYVPQKYNSDGTLNEDYIRYFSDDWQDEKDYHAEIRREVEMLKREAESENC
jgi:hypothetical protein